MTEIINLTPHPLNLELGGKMVEIPSSGVARCATTVVDVIENLNGLSEEDKDYFDPLLKDCKEYNQYKDRWPHNTDTRRDGGPCPVSTWI